MLPDELQLLDENMFASTPAFKNVFLIHMAVVIL